MVRMMQRLTMVVVGLGMLGVAGISVGAQPEPSNTPVPKQPPVAGKAVDGKSLPAAETVKPLENPVGPAKSEPARSEKAEPTVREPDKADSPKTDFRNGSSRNGERSKSETTGSSSRTRESVYVDFAPAEAPAANGKADARKPDANGKPAAGEKKMSFLFRYAPWEKVLQRFAQEAQLTLDMNDIPPGTFNYYDNGLYTPTEALDILNGYLLSKGFVLVRRDRFLVVAPTDRIPPSLIPQVTLADLPNRGRNEILSVVMPLDNSMDAKTAVEDVKEMLNSWGKVVPLTKANRLLITDTAANLMTIQELLTGMGGVAEPKANAFRSFKLKFVSATDAERMLRDLFALAPRGTITSTNVAQQPANNTNAGGNWGGGSGRWGGGGGGGRWGGGGGGGRWGGGEGGWSGRDVSSMATPSATTTTQAVPTAARLQMTVDTRTNSLLVAATGEDLKLVEEFIKSVDVSDGPAGVAMRTRRSNTPQLEVYALETAEPHVVVEVLKTTVPGLVIHEDVKSRRLNVYATPAEHEIVRNVVKQVDGGAGETVAVLQLQRLDPLQAATSFRAMFGGTNNRQQDAPSIEADSAGRRLLVKGTTEQITQIRKMLKELDGDGSADQADARQTGPYRMVSPGGRSADDIVSLIKMLANDTRTTIRVVSPSAIAVPQFRTREIEEPETPKSRPEAAPRGKAIAPDTKIESKKEPASQPLKTSPREAHRAGNVPAANASVKWIVVPGKAQLQLAAAEENRVEANEAAPNVTDKPAAESKKSGTGAEVRISTYGGNIMLYSDDQAALNRVEKLIESVVRAAPPKTTWSVYHLRVADATEVSLMLGQLFPQGSIGQPESTGSFSGLGSALGGSLLSMARGSSLSSSSQALRIVPETRNNSLFISGSEEQVNQVLEALKILDATERPESLKDRVARMISVEHADVDEVADIVRDVYKEQMDGGQTAAAGGANTRVANRGGNFNPLAMLMGGAAGQNARPKDVQLSIGVDRRTNMLIVSANDQLYRQVESLVKALDESAHEANRTIRVVNLQNGNAVAMQQALGAMLTKVKVNGAGKTNNNNTPAGTPGAGTSPWVGGQSTDDVRKFWRQQMMNSGAGFGATSGQSGNTGAAGGNFGRRNGGGNFGGGGGNFGGRGGRGGRNN